MRAGVVDLQNNSDDNDVPAAGDISEVFTGHKGTSVKITALTLNPGGGILIRSNPCYAPSRHTNLTFVNSKPFSESIQQLG